MYTPLSVGTHEITTALWRWLIIVVFLFDLSVRAVIIIIIIVILHGLVVGEKPVRRVRTCFLALCFSTAPRHLRETGHVIIYWICRKDKYYIISWSNLERKTDGVVKIPKKSMTVHASTPRITLRSSTMCFSSDHGISGRSRAAEDQSR